jgi:hypothetical protein
MKSLRVRLASSLSNVLTQASVLALSGALVLGLSLAATGCKKEYKLIERVSFKPSSNLETIRVSLVFSKQVQSDLAGGFTIKDYGFLFINPFTPSEPFEIGFNLNTSIVNDQEYVAVTPTEFLPNGNPIGVGHPLVEVRGAQPISTKFDLYGYVDVSKLSWIGVAAMFSFLNDQYFPAGLTVSQAFLQNAQGAPGILASVFGPTLASDGTLKKAGGIALFANVKQLIAAGLQEGQSLDLYPEQMPNVEGKNAAFYQGNVEALRTLEDGVLRAFQEN